MEKITLPQYLTIFSIAYPKKNFVYGRVERVQVRRKEIPTNIEELRAVADRLIIKKRGGVKPFSLTELRAICKEFRINCSNKKQAIENLRRLL